MVFAHYMLTNQDYQADDDPTQEKKIAGYEQEIEQARALGVDGFALNVGGWLREPYYVRYAAQMFEAAARLNNGFKLMFSADFCCGNGAEDVEDMMRRFANNPRYTRVYFRHDGQFVLTTFAGDSLGTAQWRQIRQDLASGTHPSTVKCANALASVSAVPSSRPLRIFLVAAFFWAGETPDRSGVERGLKEWSDVIDGSFYWGIAGVPGSGGALDNVRSSEAYASAVHAAHRLYMAPVTVQFWGANANRYYEYSGGAGMRAMWMDAIVRSHPEWVEIITWNDFIEGTYISPIDDPSRYPQANQLVQSGVPAGTPGYFHDHAAAGRLMSYFIRWYKTGVPPPIRDDAIYWFYRTQPMNADAGVPAKNKFGPVEVVIYITANLNAPATLRVESGGRVTLIPLSAGSHDVSAPFAAGEAPTFTLSRAGRVVLQGRGVDPIDASPRYNNFYYSTGMAEASAAGSEVARLVFGGGTVEVRSLILKRLVRLRDMKPIAAVAHVMQLITSNYLRGE